MYGNYINGWLLVSSFDPYSGLPDVTVAPRWNDLIILAGLERGLYYQVTGASPHRVVSFEWICSSFGHTDTTYRFAATFFEDFPGLMKWTISSSWHKSRPALLIWEPLVCRGIARINTRPAERGNAPTASAVEYFLITPRPPRF